MKGITLFAAICFCLWFLSEIVNTIGRATQLIENNMDMALKNILIYFQGNIARLLVSLSGTMFFFVLYSKQLKKK